MEISCPITRSLTLCSTSFATMLMVLTMLVFISFGMNFERSFPLLNLMFDVFFFVMVGCSLC